MGVPRDCDLSGVRLKLDRAREHIDAIRDLSAAFRAREPSLTLSLTGPAETRFVLSVTARDVTFAESGVSAGAAATT